MQEKENFQSKNRLNLLSDKSFELFRKVMFRHRFVYRGRLLKTDPHAVLKNNFIVVILL